MEYNMSSKNRSSTVSNAALRSGYGDMHAHRNTLMMEEHVAMLLKHKMVDETMAVNLLEPLDKCWTYTKEYLQTHPEYTGVQPEMTAYSTAMRHQTKRDREMAKFVADYEAGRIDEWGDPINVDTSGEESGSEDAKTNLSSSSSSEQSKTETAHSTASSSTSPSNPPTITLPSPPKHPSPTPAQSNTSDSALTRPSFSCSTSSSPKSQSQSQSQSRKRKYRADPLSPLPGGEDYSQYTYYQLLAICRDRAIHCPGDTQEVRNLLIQDDINVAQGLPRDLLKAWHSKKRYKTKVSERLEGGSCSSASDGKTGAKKG